MHLHVICGFPCMPLLRWELVSIVPGRVDAAGGIFSKGNGCENFHPFVRLRFFEALVEAFRNRIAVGQALSDLTSNLTALRSRLQ